ncbi:hypothetical protein CDAR_34071 [Caerostris darwini]|uniref:Uncharacterized protein n=1 Tax=Caerostris darwini TaxID=1538125 RepID=A0AAV4RB38_9ARAC|nr:hypothetical protein CDAR_34071 [Caerostris darwini]
MNRQNRKHCLLPVFDLTSELKSFHMFDSEELFIMQLNVNFGIGTGKNENNVFPLGYLTSSSEGPILFCRFKSKRPLTIPFDSNLWSSL